MKNGNNHFNIESFAPIAVVNGPKQIKESANYNKVELSSRALGKRECDTIDENIRQKSHCIQCKQQHEKTMNIDNGYVLLSVEYPKFHCTNPIWY